MENLQLSSKIWWADKSTKKLRETPLSVARESASSAVQGALKLVNVVILRRTIPNIIVPWRLKVLMKSILVKINLSMTTAFHNITWMNLVGPSKI